jgi:hypothetical protein
MNSLAFAFLIFWFSFLPPLLASSVYIFQQGSGISADRFCSSPHLPRPSHKLQDLLVVGFLLHQVSCTMYT